jgi:transcriptional regulator with XRE-family HTH domain
MEKKVLQAFGRTVRAAREKAGLSQEELAQAAKLHRTYIGGIERGERNLSLINISRIARALSCTPGELLEGLR